MLVVILLCCILMIVLVLILILIFGLSLVVIREILLRLDKRVVDWDTIDPRD